MDVPSGSGVAVDMIGVVVRSGVVQADARRWSGYSSSLVDLCLCLPYPKQIYITINSTINEFSRVSP